MPERKPGKVCYPGADAAKAKCVRSLTSRIAIPAGTFLTEELLFLKRPGTGIPRYNRARIIGNDGNRACSGKSNHQG